MSEYVFCVGYFCSHSGVKVLEKSTYLKTPGSFQKLYLLHLLVDSKQEDLFKHVDFPAHFAHSDYCFV